MVDVKVVIDLMSLMLGMGFVLGLGLGISLGEFTLPFRRR